MDNNPPTETLTPELAKQLAAMDAPAGSLKRRLYLTIRGFSQLLMESTQTMPPKARLMTTMALPMLMAWLLGQVQASQDGKLRQYVTFLQSSLSSVVRKDCSDLEALQAIHDAFEKLKDTDADATPDTAPDHGGAQKDAISATPRRTLGHTGQDRHR